MRARLLLLATVIAACGDGNGTPADGGALDALPIDGGPALDATGSDGSDGDATDLDGGGDTYTVTGRVTYDWVEAKDDYTEGGARLDYSSIRARPARRVVVQAVPMLGNMVAAETTTDDDGNYSLAVPTGRTLHVRVLAETRGVANVPDGIPPDRCNGASWRARVVDNTMRYANYVVDDNRTISSNAAINIHAALEYSNGYVDRTAAPFTLLDTVLTEFELVCEGNPAVDLPLLNINWSENNVASGDNIETGEIGTSYYDRVRGTSNLFIVGEAEVDSDEYDDHIIAHETGHYLEDRLYRSDSQGGDHVDYDTLDPATAFGEGFGNAISGMTFDDPIYVDTSGEGQVGGFSFDVSEPPSGDDRGIYSEWSADYFLWSLYENRDAAPRSGNYDRIHDILRNHQRTTEAVTCLQTFAAYYNQTYGGDAEQLAELWSDGLGTPFDSLCAGPCTGTADMADVWDTDNDLGREYAGVGTSTIPRKYPQQTGVAYPAEFWRLYPEVTVGFNAATEHSQSRFDGFDYGDNKFGAVRWYRLLGNGARMTVNAVNPGGSNCNVDVMDLGAYELGVEIASDYELTGCPTIEFPTVNARNYVLIVYGLTRELSSWDLDISSPKKSPPIRVELIGGGEVTANRDVPVSVRVTPLRAFSNLEIKVRGVEGVSAWDAERTTRQSGPARTTIEHRAKVRAGDSVAGYLVADLAWKVGARTYRISKPFPVRAPGTRRALRPMGVLAEGPGGEPIEILRPRMR